MIYITKAEYFEPVSNDGACYGDLLDFQGVEYEVIE